MDEKSFETLNREFLKRKGLIPNKQTSKYLKIVRTDSDNGQNYINRNTLKINNSDINLEIEEFQNMNTFNKSVKIDMKKKTLVDSESEKLKCYVNKNFNDSKLILQSDLSTYCKKIENEHSKINDDIKIFNNKSEGWKNKLFMNHNSTISNNNKANLIKIHKPSEKEKNYSEDSLISLEKTSTLEDRNNANEIENSYNVFLNKIDKSCCIPNIMKSRMSVEVIYDKTSLKPKPKESVEINENGEEIILDSSQEEVNSKASDKANKNMIATLYENCKDEIHSKNDFNLSKNHQESIPHIKSNLFIQNEKNIFIDDIAINYNDKLSEYSYQQTGIQTTNEQSTAVSTLLKNGNSMIVTISDSDNSLIDDYAKRKCLNSIKLNHNNIKFKKIEKEINFNIKLKCLLSIDENSKEIYQREIMNVSCEQSNNTNLMTQKIADSSTSTACLADISASDNKDSSPASVNSIPQLYNLQPSRLSFVSTVSSSSSASCAVSMATRKFNKDSNFSYGTSTKHVKKHVNDLNSEDKQNWDAFEKLSKEWKNSHIIISKITNFLNSDMFIFDCDKGSSDLIENSQMIRSSTPELDVEKKIIRKSIPTIRKAKFTKQLRNSKIMNKNNKLHNLFNTPVIPIKELKTIEFSSNTSTSEIDNEFLDKEVFAKWSDNNYYPGKVTDIVKTKYKVIFFDGKSKLLLPDFILPIKQNLEIGFSAYAYISEDHYASSVMIVDIEKRSDKVFYTIETDEGQKIKTMINNIFLTSDQAKLFREQIIKGPTISSIPQQLSHVTIDNVLSNKRRFKRVSKASVYKSKLKPFSMNELNSNVFQPSVSGLQNNLQEKFVDKKNITCNYKEENQLLEVQSEITGTLIEQIVKGPLNKIKGKARNRKNIESLNDVEVLGPIPEVNSDIFKGMVFIFSCISPKTLIRYQMVDESNESNSEPGTENEEEWLKRPFVRDHLQAQIIAGGGKVYDNFEDIPPEEYPNTKHITNVPNLTKKSLLCLSVGIRSYNHQWVIRSCQQNKAIQPAEEELPSGWSLDKQAYIDTYQRPKNKPLEHTIVAIPLLECIQFVEFWKKICENAGASVQILKNPAESFMEATVILTNKSCPIWIINQANNWQIPILSTTWVIHCLIEGKLCSSNAKKEYKFSCADSYD